MRIYHRSRAVGLAAAVAATALLAACSSMLDVQNPGAITEDNLKDASMLPSIVNGALGEFQPAFIQTAFYSGIFADELLDRHTYQGDKPIDIRNIDPSNANINAYVYVPLQRARGAADRGIEQAKSLLGDKASSNMDVARLYDYGGYSLVLLAETFCSAPIDLGKANTPAELFRMAIDRFNSAITVAAAARSAGGNAASADSLTALANLGIARASLNLNDKTTAAAKAQLVPASFGVWANYSSASSRQYNFIGDQIRIGNEYAGYDPSFLNLNDPRIPQDAAPIPVPFNTTALVWVPYQTPQYSGFRAGVKVRIDRNTSVRFASGLEAQYIVAEAQGSTAATLAFVNSRRAVGNQAPVTSSGDQLMADLRDQRRRDLFLAAYRLGDLQRYLKYYSVDSFPKGLWPGDDLGGSVYGTQTCMPLPNSETNNNPNLNG